MHLGLLYKIKKKRACAVQHLTDAKRVLSNSAKPRSLRGSKRPSQNSVAKLELRGDRSYLAPWSMPWMATDI